MVISAVATVQVGCVIFTTGAAGSIAAEQAAAAQFAVPEAKQVPTAPEGVTISVTMSFGFTPVTV